MSKTLTIRFNDKEEKVQIFAKYDELVSFIKNHFSIDDDKMFNLSIFYYDSDGDQISFQSENDYKLFIEDDSQEEKIIECEIVNKESQDISIEQQPDPMKSGTIFNKKVPEQTVDLNIKNNLDNSSLLGNSLYSIESLNNAMVFQKKNNNKECEDFAKGLNQINANINKTLENNEKDDLIEKMKKQMEELIKQHQEEIRKKEEENNSRYQKALAEKDNEMKKKLEEKEKLLNEERLKKENEMREKYEIEMKSNLQLREMEMKSKIELENQKKLEEIKKKEIENQKKLEEIRKKEEENLKKLEELKKLEKENLKKIEQEKLKIEEEKKKLEEENKKKKE